MIKLRFLAAAACISLLAIASPIKVNATDSDLYQIRCTCYYYGDITYSGHPAHEGVIAGRKEDLGKVAALYKIADDGSLGDFIGYFDFYDIGAGADTDGDGKGDSIIKGKSVDVYRNNNDRVWKFIHENGDYVYIKIIDAEG